MVIVQRFFAKFSRPKLYHGSSTRHGVLCRGARVIPAFNLGVSSNWPADARPESHHVHVFATTDIYEASAFAHHAATHKFAGVDPASPIIYEVSRSRDTEPETAHPGRFRSATGFRVKAVVS